MKNSITILGLLFVLTAFVGCNDQINSAISSEEIPTILSEKNKEVSNWELVDTRTFDSSLLFNFTTNYGVAFSNKDSVMLKIRVDSLQRKEDTSENKETLFYYRFTIDGDLYSSRSTIDSTLIIKKEIIPEAEFLSDLEVLLYPVPEYVNLTIKTFVKPS